MRKRQEEMMEYLITKFRLNSQSCKGNSIEQNQFYCRIMKLKKLWRCMRNSTNGMKQSKLLREREDLMSMSSRTIITVGSLKLGNNRRQEKSKKMREIIILPFNYISKEECHLELQMLFIIVMQASLRMSSKKLLSV